MNIFKTEKEARREAISTLVRLGFARYINSENLYHGRAGNGTEWQVEPQFNNASNNTGNKNVYNISGIYASDINIANQFAQKRVSENNPNVEIHRILGIDNDAIVLDTNFNPNNLSSQDLIDYKNAMNTITRLSVSRAIPIRFEYRNVYSLITSKLSDLQTTTGIKNISNQQIVEVCNSLILLPEIQNTFNNNYNKLHSFVHEIVSAQNSRILLNHCTNNILRNYEQGITNINFANTEGDYPLSVNYMSSWCEHNHIVGFVSRVKSATLKKELETCHLFDTKKIVSDNQYIKKNQEINRIHSNISQLFEGITDYQTKEFLKVANSDEIMQFIYQDTNCNTLFNMDSGIWEGWTVGQHTQAVLEFFDRYHSDNIPENLYPLIKISMLAHDIGKGYSRIYNHDQKQGTELMAGHLYNALNIPYNYQKLIDFIIFDSQEYTTSILKNGATNSVIEYNFEKNCKKKFKESLDIKITKEDIESIKIISRILQECDSGSYTRYASIKEGKSYVTGGNDRFTSSFVLNKYNKPRLKAFEETKEL